MRSERKYWTRLNVSVDVCKELDAAKERHERLTGKPITWDMFFMMLLDCAGLK